MKREAQTAFSDLGKWLLFVGHPQVQLLVLALALALAPAPNQCTYEYIQILLRPREALRLPTQHSIYYLVAPVAGKSITEAGGL